MSLSSYALLLDFEEFSATQWFGNSFVHSNGYRISPTGSSLFTGAIADTSFCFPTCPDNGGRYLLGHSAGFEITSLSGAGFGLSGFDGA